MASIQALAARRLVGCLPTPRAATLPEARAWQEDTELTNLTTTTEGRLQDDGRSSHWVFHFVSRSALQTNIMRVSAGTISSTPGTVAPRSRIGPGTRLDTQELNGRQVSTMALA